MLTTKAGRLRLLGSFRLELDSTEVKVGQARLEELIAFLALRPGTTVPRRQLAFQLWPNSTEKQAHTNVRNLLHKLKKSWPTLQGSIDVDRNGVTWRTDGEVTVDLEQFRSLSTHAKQLDEPQAALEVSLEAAALYHGDLLPNCYSDWAISERERVRAEYAAVLERSIDLLVDRRRYREALVWARRLVDHDALRESSHRRLIQIHCLLDDRAAALRAYHHCASLLEQELGVSPSHATQVLHAQVLQHPESAPDRYAGPQEITRPVLVGRHAEWQALRQVWHNAQAGRAQCVLIWGEAGIGKTRLAQELVDWARRQGHAWATSRAYAAQGAMTYTPIAEWLRSPQIAPRLETLDDLWRVELARVLPELLAARPDLPQPGALRESWQQQRFYHGITQALQAESTPLLLHLDDMQWTAQENLILLQYLLHNAPTHPVLIVGTIRTEDALENRPLAAFADALRHQGRLTELRLGPLSQEETTALVYRVRPCETDWAWVYLGICIVSLSLNASFLLRTSPETIAERGRPQETQGWDKFISGAWAAIHFVLLPLVAGLDARYGWTGTLGIFWNIAGAVILSVGLGLASWAMFENAYFSTAVRIQSERGQTVCRSGPYRFVRHPGYVGFIGQSLGTPVLLGSLWALLLGFAAVALMIVRTALEDRFLQAELPGYGEYVEDVRSRLVPGIW